MWVFLNNAFLSIVEHRDDPNYLLVRSRNRRDLLVGIGACEVEETPDADYPFRAKVTRRRVMRAMEDRIRGINYDNFKNSISPEEEARHDAYFDVWTTMRKHQVRKAVPRRRGRFLR